jgi:hypothetical protein
MFRRPFEVCVIYRTIKGRTYGARDHLGIDSQPFRARLILAGRPSGPRERRGSLLRFSHPGISEVLALPEQKRVMRGETLSRSSKALLPPHKCGGSHLQFGQG